MADLDMGVGSDAAAVVAEGFRRDGLTPRPIGRPVGFLTLLLFERMKRTP